MGEEDDEDGSRLTDVSKAFARDSTLLYYLVQIRTSDRLLVVKRRMLFQSTTKLYKDSHGRLTKQKVGGSSV